jgi:hypothetical protein
MLKGNTMSKSVKTILQLLLCAASVIIMHFAGKIPALISFAASIKLPFVAINAVLFGLCYGLYFFISKITMLETKPFLWLLLILAAGVVSFLLEYYNAHGSLMDMLFPSSIMRFIDHSFILLWTNAVLVYLIEWIASGRDGAYERRNTFRRIGHYVLWIFFIMTIRFFFEWIVLYADEENTAKRYLIICGAYLFAILFNLIEAFNGLREETCKKLLSSSNDGTTETKTYHILEGMEASNSEFAPSSSGLRLDVSCSI